MAVKTPIPLLGDIDSLQRNIIPDHLSPAQRRDFIQASHFLLCYAHNNTTFRTYRREIERLLQWCQHKAKKTLKQLRYTDFEDYIEFCQNPFKRWIGLKVVSRFKMIKGARQPNPEWRPFVALLPKAQVQQGKQPKAENYQLSPKSLQDIFTINSSFFNFLIQEKYVSANPVQQIRQKNKYFTKQQTKKVIRKLSELQWGYVIETAELMAQEDAQHERTLFIMTLLYSLYLRISELAANIQWSPTMGDFARDADGLWWFTTVGKGNKQRQIAVSRDTIKSLMRWRQHLKLAPLPAPGEQAPLIMKHRGRGPITSTRPIRVIVQACFDATMERLKKDGFEEDSQQLMNATVHWLRHTGISEDVKIRPREHVRDDAGHSSGSITDRYIDVELRERHQSAQKKKVTPESFIDQSEGT